MLADLYRKALIPFFQPHYYAPNSIFCFLRIGITKARFLVSCFLFLLQVTSFSDSSKSLASEDKIDVYVWLCVKIYVRFSLKRSAWDTKMRQQKGRAALISSSKIRVTLSNVMNEGQKKHEIAITYLSGNLERRFHRPNAKPHYFNTLSSALATSDSDWERRLPGNFLESTISSLNKKRQKARMVILKKRD